MQRLDNPAAASHRENSGLGSECGAIRAWTRG